MILKIGDWRRKRKERLADWHRYYAWWPVTMADGNWAWLERVERLRCTTAVGFEYWLYREEE